MTKLSEEYFENRIKNTFEISYKDIEVYGLIREIEGKIEYCNAQINDFKQDDSPLALAIRGAFVLDVKDFEDQLTTIRKEAGL